MDIKLDVNQLADQVISALKPLAEKLGKGADALYQLAVKDARITGWQSLVELVVLALLSWYIIRLLFKWGRAIQDGSWDGISWLFLGICAVGIVAGDFVIGMILFESTAHYLFNPEYMAVQEVIKLVK